MLVFRFGSSVFGIGRVWRARLGFFILFGKVAAVELRGDSLGVVFVRTVRRVGCWNKCIIFVRFCSFGFFSRFVRVRLVYGVLVGDAG